MPLRPCLEPGCPELIPLDESRCLPHKREDQRRRNQRRGDSTQRGYDYRWSKTRQRFLRDNPKCARCGDKSVDVHHKDGQGPRGERGHDTTNLKALCHGCHSALTGTPGAVPPRRAGVDPRAVATSTVTQLTARKTSEKTSDEALNGRFDQED